MGVVKEDLNKRIDIPCSISKLNMVKMSVLHKLMYRFSAIPSENLSRTFCSNSQANRKCLWKYKISIYNRKIRTKLQDLLYLISGLTTK